MYDKNEYLVRNSDSLWNDTTKTWVANSETDFYNDNSGRVDSSKITNYTQAFTSTSYFSYYSSSGKIFQKTNYLNYTTNFSRETFFYDSTNHIEEDSAITQTVINDSTSYINSIFKQTSFYDANNYKIEEEFYDQIIGIFEIGDTKVFYIYAPCASVYPITLLNFSAERQNSNALLHWQTINETNTSTFTIQRSTDGEHFISIVSIAASGNSTTNKSYTYTDMNAFFINASKLYYRLLETDKNGSISYSKIVTLDIAAGKLSVYISPNPVTGIINLYAANNISQAHITITDIKGKIMYATSQNINAGSKSSINASAWAKGMYIITVQTASGRQQLKMIKE